MKLVDLRGVLKYVALCLFAVLGTEARAQVGFPYCESFQTASTQANTIFGGEAALAGGVLRLTTNQLNQRGYVYIDVPFPSVYGLKVEFEFFMYGGSGADGLTMFLFDAATSSFSPGGFGGSLGYAQREGQPGLTGAYLGLGFDAFGNYGNVIEGKVGGFFGGNTELYPNSIILRKGGVGILGYEFFTGKITQDPPSGANDLALDVNYRFPLSSGGQGSQRVTDRNQVGYRKVFLELEPHPSGVGYLVKLEMEVTTEAGKPRLVTIFPDIHFPYQAPENLKIGFAGSTGGMTNFHEIRNLIVSVSADDALKNPQGKDLEDFTACAGQENQFYIDGSDIVLPNENSAVRCLQFYRTMEEIEAEEEDLCTQARCHEHNRILTLPEGIITATDGEGGFSFFPNEDYIGKELKVYYTLTDNYGKASSGNSITLKIEESPMPINLLVSGEAEAKGQVDICPGKSVTLEGIGGEIYERYEWYKDGELISGAVNATFSASEAGDYEIWGYNKNNCPRGSNVIKVNLPDFPSAVIAPRVVQCVPGQPLDLTAEFSEYDPTTYDYRLEGMGMVLLNEELKSVAQAGVYEISAKLKTLDCYSEPKSVEVVIQDIELEVEFDFGVKGTGVKGESGGGIFPTDEIQFTDLSDERAIRWHWDFGDGSESVARNPSHIFGKKGVFEVVLTIWDENECLRILQKNVEVTRSYRLMIPTGFTPEGSDNNTFLPKHKGLVQFELLIFNTWGELIFRSDDLQTLGWDGKLGGKLLDAGVYAYRVNGQATDGEKVEESGKFRLIR